LATASAQVCVPLGHSSLYCYIATMGLSLTVSEINGDFGQKSQIFQPRVFCASAEGIPLVIGYRHWGSKKN